MRIKTILIIMLFITSTYGQNPGVLSGFITDKKTGEPLVYTNITVQNTSMGTMTNKEGYFYLSLVPGHYVLEYSHVGYDVFTHQIKLTNIGVTQLDIKLTPRVIPLSEINVMKERNQNAALTSTIALQMREITMVPIAGTKDLTRILSALPGITFNHDLSSKIYIRGGDPDQTLFLIDGAPVFFPEHLFGYFSMFNTDAIKNVQVIKSNPPVEYFGRNGSVVDITNYEGNHERIKIKVDFGFINSGINFEGPIGKGSYFLSGRRTYFDLGVKLLELMGLENVGIPTYYFYDTQYKLTYPLTKKDKISISGFTSNDLLSNFSPDLRFDEPLDSAEDIMSSIWNNNMYTIKWNRLITQELLLNVHYYNVLYDAYVERSPTIINNIYDGIPNRTELYFYDNQFRDAGLNADIQYFGWNDHKTKLGFGIKDYHFSYAANGIYYYGINTVTKSIIIPHVYLKDSWKLNPRLNVNTGLRLSGFSEKPKTAYFDPRLSFKYQLNENSYLKGGLGRHTQYIFMISPVTLYLLSTMDIWFPAGKNIPPSISDHITGGFEYFISKSTYMDMEFFFSKTNHSVLFKPNARPFNDMTEIVFQGNAVNYGMDLYFERYFGNHKTWVGYTYSVSNRRYENYNKGKYFRTKFNRLHEVNIVGEFNIGDRWEGSLHWVGGTGQPYTAVSGVYGLTDYFYPSDTFGEYWQLSPENEFTLPPYHRLDIGVTRHYVRRKYNMDLRITIFNVYNHRNDVGRTSSIYAYLPGYEEGKNIKLMPIMPTINLTLEY